MAQSPASFVSSERRGVQIANRWKNALASRELTDVEFAVGRQCGGAKTIRAHRLILSMSSDVFHTMFNGSLTERVGAAIDIPDIPPNAFDNMLCYIYTGSVDDLKPENVLQTLYCADKYDLPWLAELSTDFVLDQLKPDNCLMYLANALRWTPDCDPVLEKCWGVVDESTVAVLQSDYFVQLDRAQLELLLRRDALSAEEHAVYTAVEKWATAACDRKNLASTPSNRRRMLGTALFRVRFPLMTDAQLFCGPAKTGLLNPKEVCQIGQHKHDPAAPLMEFSSRPRAHIVCRTSGGATFKKGEKIFFPASSGYWYPAIMTNDYKVFCDLFKSENAKKEEKDKEAVVLQVLRIRAVEYSETWSARVGLHGRNL
ncbi:BTB/POZ domain-containing protein 1-like [Paramacrobiotus metropolitanus]|uniref:BTB/POZ domain-containing protein 1-like n=1 Tax=Paramacrobiotus metropolitanus TaxID=2943436 RepID=UPI002445DC94|nr:BTB/POZ domain-containing protein 1-like [Paramacrobiotus metropolitanus]